MKINTFTFVFIFVNFFIDFFDFSLMQYNIAKHDGIPCENLLNMNLTGNTYVHLKENPVFFAINLGTDTKFFDKVNYGVVSDYNYFYHLEEESTAYLTNTNMAGVNFSNYQKNKEYISFFLLFFRRESILFL